MNGRSLQDALAETCLKGVESSRRWPKGRPFTVLQRLLFSCAGGRARVIGGVGRGAWLGALATMKTRDRFCELPTVQASMRNCCT